MFVRPYPLRGSRRLAPILDAARTLILIRNNKLVDLGINVFNQYEYDLKEATLTFWCTVNHPSMRAGSIRFSALPVGSYDCGSEPVFLWTGAEHPALAGCTAMDKIVRRRSRVAEARAEIAELVSAPCVLVDESDCWGITGLLLRDSDLGGWCTAGGVYFIITALLPTGEA